MNKYLVISFCFPAFVLLAGCSGESDSAIASADAPESESPARMAPAEKASDPILTSDQLPEQVTRLAGYWRRPDGGYTLLIKSPAPNGFLEAGYFNPRPIHVSKSNWTRLDNERIGVFIELQDTNYNGATYHLAYDQTGDVLSGTYYQPALGQEFQVTFERVKE